MKLDKIETFVVANPPPRHGGRYFIFDGHHPRLCDLDLSEAVCCQIRAAMGDKADLLFGTHGQFTVSGAKRMARRLEAYDPLWFEEPIPPKTRPTWPRSRASPPFRWPRRWFA